MKYTETRPQARQKYLCAQENEARVIYLQPSYIFSL